MIDLGPTPHRAPQIVEKIGREITGLNGSIFVHVALVPRGNRYEVLRIAISEKSKDGSTLEVVLNAVADVLTGIIRDYCNGVLEPVDDRDATMETRT